MSVAQASSPWAAQVWPSHRYRCVPRAPCVPGSGNAPCQRHSLSPLQLHTWGWDGPLEEPAKAGTCPVSPWGHDLRFEPRSDRLLRLLLSPDPTSSCAGSWRMRSGISWCCPGGHSQRKGKSEVRGVQHRWLPWEWPV